MIEERRNPPCPYLPTASDPRSAASMRELGPERGAVFYGRALECAQALWQKGFPAQAILLLNRSLGSDLTSEDSILEQWPLPYRAMQWILENRRPEQFIGNPRRHFQHLATRMVEPRKAVRSSRAWACWALARQSHPEFPADEKQLIRDGIIEPEVEAIFQGLETSGLPGEAELWRGVLRRGREFPGAR